MKSFLIKYLIFLVFLLSFSCREDDMGSDVPIIIEEMEEEMDPDTNPDPNTDPDIDPLYDSLDSDFIYDDDQLHTFELLLSEENLNKINNDPAAEEYVEGMIKFNGETFGPVGIRYKGSIGAFVNCLSNPNWTNPSGFKTCTKLSMKVKCNWEDSNRKFYGLKKLQFHAMNLDESQMHDRLGYHLFRSVGIPAPRCVHAKLLINGEYNGLFALVEQIDGRFTKYNYEEGDGNLYKEVWPMKMDGTANDEAAFISGLKTNEDNPNVSIARNFAQAIELADDEELKNIVKTRMNKQEILSYCVVDRMIKHDDGPFHWYCNGNECEPHNFYWYEDPSTNKMHLIPWDLDNAFENILEPNPVTNVRDDFGDITNNCLPFTSGFFGFRQWSASCDKLFQALILFEEDYEAIKLDFKNGSFSKNNTDQLLDKWSQQIEEATQEAFTTHGNDALHPNTWNASLNRLKQALDVSRAN